MKAFLLITMLGLLGGGAQASTNGYDIIITCENSPGTPTKTIELKLNTFGRSALLKYQGAEAADSFKVAIRDSQSYNSSSDVWIKNGSTGGQGGTRSLSISAHHSETFRVTQFAQFSFELEEDAQGAYFATSLSMSSGTLEFAESIKEKSVDLQNMACVISK